ncbi:Hypothetical predicted protein [Podarcis lilfordi]|uniref:Uncharacterized protein n=1 Tax=Podarcis lilfordi TaxID=74358 RepID=A0AA35KK56_9SAUR|nr:Hypothetical predicted protein [Podarcis lilfordi]
MATEAGREPGLLGSSWALLLPAAGEGVAALVLACWALSACARRAAGGQAAGAVELKAARMVSPPHVPLSATLQADSEGCLGRPAPPWRPSSSSPGKEIWEQSSSSSRRRRRNPGSCLV